ncbi:MAG: riboflavin biosynthesis protein RibF [Candidatus Omnitrophota bacterium]|nr:riboflavin biosynthesis protein RibF [Candidatus Omnitrophota bacterium]
MQILSNIDSYQRSSDCPLILAIGNFDGVHLGHQLILKRVTQRAHYLRGKAAVLTFVEHPQRVLHPGSKPLMLNSLEQRLWLLKKTGLDICFLIHFTESFSQQEPADFVKNVLVDQLGVCELYLGSNARFGKNRVGDASLMQKIASKLDFAFEEVGPVMVGEEVVSSSRIRELVREGQIEKASAFLGRLMTILGMVVAGDGRGRELGFPTANLKIRSDVLPPEGVYPVLARPVELSIEDSCAEASKLHAKREPTWHQGLLNYGRRPTFKEGESGAIAEVFILDFEGDLYGQTLELCLFDRLRPEKAFSGAEDLKTQISADVLECRNFFKNRENNNFTSLVD